MNWMKWYVYSVKHSRFIGASGENCLFICIKSLFLLYLFPNIDIRNRCRSRSINYFILLSFEGKSQTQISTYMTFTTLTRPNKASVVGWTSFNILGASSDSVLRAFITSGAPSADVKVVIFYFWKTWECRLLKCFRQVLVLKHLWIGLLQRFLH